MSTLRLLTPREHEVAALVAAGFSNKHIARQLQMAEGTVKVHLHNIFEKLGISNRTTLAALMLGVHKDYAETRDKVLVRRNMDGLIKPRPAPVEISKPKRLGV